jgi:CheY-like chemotaxis protein
MTQAPDAGPAARILLVDADPALSGLIEEWLAALGCSVVQERPDLILVDVAFPRQGGADVLKRLGAEHPGTPLLALSSNFFGRIERNGAVARALGVAAVLPKPVSREALIAAVRNLVPVLG